MEENLLKANIDNIVNCLEELGVSPTINADQTVSFVYQGEHYYVQFNPHFVAIWDFQWQIINIYEQNWHDIYSAYNLSNFRNVPTILMSTPNEKGEITVSSVYRFWNIHHDMTGDLMKSILFNFSQVKLNAGYTYNEYLAHKDRPSEFILPEIGFKPYSNITYLSTFAPDLPLKTEEVTGKNIVGDTPVVNADSDIQEFHVVDEPQEEESSENLEKEESSGPTVADFQEVNRQLLMLKRDNVSKLLVKLGCQPENLEDTVVRFYYQGMTFVMEFFIGSVRVNSYDWVTIDADDSLSIHCFNEALWHSQTLESPKIFLRPMDEDGKRRVLATYLYDEHFIIKNGSDEFNLVGKLNSWLKVFMATRGRLLYIMDDIKKHILENQNQE